MKILNEVERRMSLEDKRQRESKGFKIGNDCDGSLNDNSLEPPEPSNGKRPKNTPNKLNSQHLKINSLDYQMREDPKNENLQL